MGNPLHWHLEDATHEYRSTMSTENMVMFSIAVSLKRIADAMHDEDGDGAAQNLMRIGDKLTHFTDDGLSAISIADLLKNKEA